MPVTKDKKRDFHTLFPTPGGDTQPPRLPTFHSWAGEIKNVAFHPFSGQQSGPLPPIVSDGIPQTPSSPWLPLGSDCSTMIKWQHFPDTRSTDRYDPPNC